jgi:DNA-binding CsgD family transcriptional regulator
MPRSPRPSRSEPTAIGAPGTEHTPRRRRRERRAPDENVAAELEASAGRAQARGGLAAAAAFLERAVALTPDPGRRAQRAVTAARAAHAAAGADAASAMLMAARRGPLDELEDAQRQLLEAEIAFNSQRGRDAAALLVAAARRLEPLDVALSRAAYLEGIWAACVAMHLASPSGQLDVSVAARAAPPATGPPNPGDLMLEGLATRFVDGFGAGAPTLQRALRDFSAIATDGLIDMAWVWLAVELWDADTWFELGTRQVQAAREAGALTVLPLALHTIAAWHVLAGDFALAETQLAEADSIMAATGDAPMSHARLRLVALQGGDAEALITASIAEATQRGEGVLVRHAEDAAATLYGEWLRRENRRVDAREQLRAAHEAFATMGAGPFAERAERELLATGETVRKRTVETRDELTPQEAQIARLARDGFTNTEIGAQLFLSPRTVEWHLRKVFGKLGITSRRQLRSTLPDGRAAVVRA